jgi:hypothetical protein
MNIAQDREWPTTTVRSGFPGYARGVASGRQLRGPDTAYAAAEDAQFAADSVLEGGGFEPSVPRVGNYAHETALFGRHGIFRPFSTAAAPDLE